MPLLAALEAILPHATSQYFLSQQEERPRTEWNIAVNMHLFSLPDLRVL